MMWYVDVFEVEEDSLVKMLGPFGSERLALQVDAGFSINLNHDEFYTIVRETTPSLETRP